MAISSTTEASGGEGVPEWDPFSDPDPQLKFLIATIVLASVMLIEDPTNQGPMRSLIMAATQFKVTVDQRREALG